MYNPLAFVKKGVIAVIVMLWFFCVLLCDTWVWGLLEHIPSQASQRKTQASQMNKRKHYKGKHKHHKEKRKHRKEKHRHHTLRKALGNFGPPAITVWL